MITVVKRAPFNCILVHRFCSWRSCMYWLLEFCWYTLKIQHGIRAGAKRDLLHKVANLFLLQRSVFLDKPQLGFLHLKMRQPQRELRQGSRRFAKGKGDLAKPQKVAKYLLSLARSLGKPQLGFLQQSDIILLQFRFVSTGGRSRSFFILLASPHQGATFRSGAKFFKVNSFSFGELGILLQN